MAGTLHRALLNKYALGTALALVIAPFAPINSAQAANNCTTASGPANPQGISNATITCTGTTNNANNNVGFGSFADNGNTYNIAPGATVSGDFTGLQLGQGTVTIGANGAITGTSEDGIAGAGALTLTNSGSISGGFRGIDISQNTLTLTNTSGASISGGSAEAVIGKTINVLANDGTISAIDAIAISASDSVTITANTGTIKVTDAQGQPSGTAIFGSNSVTISSNTGTISADKAVASFGTVNINNGATGQINGGSVGISASDTATIANAGTISATKVSSTAISAGTVNLANSGTITAGTPASDGKAISADTVNITANSGTISALGASGGGAVGINAITAVTIGANTGTISGAKAIVSGGDANITNSSGGQINGARAGIVANGTATVANAGTISATSNSSTAINADTVIITANSGNISGTSSGISAGTNVTVQGNTGTISGNTAISTEGTANITNSLGGRIMGVAIGIDGATTITNAGTISGNIGIRAGGPTTITNFGTIKSTAGATGTAIQLSSAADTLNIKAGSKIIGMIDMGGGADVINVDGGASSVPKGVSMLSRAASAVGAVVAAIQAQLTPDSASTVINVVGGNGSSTSSGQPSVTVNGVTASLDPTALAQQDRTLMDFTGGMSSMVQDRLRGSAGGGAGGPMAMSYAMEDAHAQMFNKAPASSWNAPVTVWSSGFGAFRKQNGTDTTLDSSSSVAGGVIGIDRRIAPNWLVGVFAGGGSGAINVDMASQKIDTDYFSIGAYSRFEWDSQFFDATLQGGGINNRSSRLVANTVAGSQDRATASYNGWFISPEIAYGYKINLGNGTTVTPTARVRYVAGTLDGFTETGSQQTLSVGGRTLQDFEERAEVEIARTGMFGDASLKGWFRGGAIALQRVGDANINAVLIGQSLTFVTPGKSSATGGVASVGFDYRLTPNVSLYGALEGMMMSDESKVGSARGGLKVAF